MTVSHILPSCFIISHFEERAAKERLFLLCLLTGCKIRDRDLITIRVGKPVAAALPPALLCVDTGMLAISRIDGARVGLPGIHALILARLHSTRGVSFLCHLKQVMVCTISQRCPLRSGCNWARATPCAVWA